MCITIMEELNNNLSASALQQKMEFMKQSRNRRRRLCSVVAPQLKVEYTEQGERTVVIDEIERNILPGNVVSHPVDDERVSVQRTQSFSGETVRFSSQLQDSVSPQDEDTLKSVALKRQCSLPRRVQLERLVKDDLKNSKCHELLRHCDMNFNIENERLQSLKPELAINLSACRNMEPLRTDCLSTRKTQRSMSAHSVALPGPDSSVLRDPVTGKMYKRGKLLGKGGFARVYEGVDLSTSKKYALKIIDKSRLARPPQREKVEAEIELHASASEVGHPNVASFDVSFENARIICLVIELCEKKSLAQYLRRKEFLSEAEVSDITWQIVGGLAHIHGCGLLHRDLKLGNILLSDDMTVKIGDFGLATRASWGNRKTICGTPNFIAPEVLQRQGHGPEADIWAVGCILYTLLVGKPPFETTSLKDTYKCILKNSYRIPSTVSQEAAELVRWMLCSKPHARPTLIDVTQHVFFAKHQTHLRYPGLEQLAKEFPSKEISAGRLPPLRRKSVLPHIYTPEKGRTWVTDMMNSCQVNHNSCPTNPCSVYSTSHRPRPCPTTTSSGPKISMANHIKQVASIVDAGSSSKTFENEEAEIEKETQQSDTNKPEPEAPKVVDVIREENQDAIVCNDANKIPAQESQKRLGKSSKDSFENNKNITKNLLGKFLRTPTSKQGSMKAKTSSPVKLLASKLQKFKIPSPKSCMKAASYTMKTKTNNTECPVIPTTPSHIVDHGEATWITKWVDYSNKYGFGYQMADGSICVLFNDGAHIALLPDGKTVEYIEPEWGASSRSMVFPLLSAPRALMRSVKILQHFTTYMDKNLRHANATEQQSKDDVVAPTSPPKNSVRMLTWSRTADYVTMYLSNGTLQVNCSDHTKINVSNIHRRSAMTVTYVNQKKETISYEGCELGNITDSGLRDRIETVHREFHHILGKDECTSHPFCSALRGNMVANEQDYECKQAMLSVA